MGLSPALMVTFPAAPPKIPYGGFSPVRLQVPGTRKFSAEPSEKSERFKSDPDVRRPAQPLSPAFGRAAVTEGSASECGAVTSSRPTWTQRPSLGLGYHGPAVIA